MLKIRLARIGRKNDPTFRVVVTEHTRGPKSGNHLEILGNYNPKIGNITLNGERIKYWISNGAQVSGTVHNILVEQGIIEGNKINVLPKKSPIVKEVDDKVKTEEVKETSSEEQKGSEEVPVEEKSDEEVKEEPKKEESDDGGSNKEQEEIKEEQEKESSEDEKKEV